MFGKEKAKAKLIANLQQTYTELSKAHGISPGDFPDVRKMQEMFKDADFAKFQALKETYLKKVNDRVAFACFTHVHLFACLFRWIKC